MDRPLDTGMATAPPSAPAAEDLAGAGSRDQVCHGARAAASTVTGRWLRVVSTSKARVPPVSHIWWGVTARGYDILGPWTICTGPWVAQTAADCNVSVALTRSRPGVRCR